MTNDKIIDCKKIAQEIKMNIQKDIEIIKVKNLILPHLEIIQVGDDFASNKYIKNKIRVADELGIKTHHNQLPSNISEDELLKIININNRDKKIHGILVQLPVPKHIDPKIIIKAINIDKDVDGFHPTNLGKLFINQPYVLPATCKGVVHILEKIELNLTGIDACVIGKSNIVGKPIANYLLNQDATVSICSKNTKNIKDYTKKADLIIIAAGSPNLVDHKMIKKNTTILDIGINQINGKITGDLKISDKLIDKVKQYSKVPGGIGIMTIISLLENLLFLYNKQIKK